MVLDLVSDMLTRIRNAALVRHAFVIVPFCKMNLGILDVLANEGYIKRYVVELKNESTLLLKVILKYKGWWIKKPLFSKLIRVSKPGKRVFARYVEFAKILEALKYNRGIAIISTSSGIMTHHKALKLKKGGEIICYIA